MQAKESFDNRKNVKNTLTLKVPFMITPSTQIILAPFSLVTNLLSLSLLPTHTSLNCWKYLVEKHSHENLSRKHSPESHLCCVISFLFADPELTELLKLECCCGWDVGESLSQPPKFYAGTSHTNNLLVTTEVKLWLLTHTKRFTALTCEHMPFWQRSSTFLQSLHLQNISWRLTH